MTQPIFDAHCDTIFELCEQKTRLYENDLQLDLKRLQDFDGYIQFFAAFVDKTGISCSPLNHCLKLIETYYAEIERNHGVMTHCNCWNDIQNALDQKKVASLLSLEGGEALDGNLSALWMFYRLGVRLITLTWNHVNELADSITESRGGGLTDFGREVVKRMNEYGMIIDVSHLSEQGFWDVAEVSKRPFVASHSCAKALCAHPRNLNDAQIQAIVEKGGCIGINFYPEFLSDSGHATVDDIVRHIQYIFSLGGHKNVGFGSDFDGVERLPENMRGVQDWPVLIDALHRAKMTEEEISDVSCNNFARVIKQIL